MEDDFELDDTYGVSDGKLGGIDIPISGMKPISGTLTYEDNELKSGCLTFDDYKVTYDGSKFTSEPGTCPIERAITYTDSNGVKYYNTEWIGANEVYYNPVTGESCTDYNANNSKTGYNGVNPTDNQTSCLKWCAYSEQNGNVNLLLDHNTTATLAWVTEDDYNKSYEDEDGARSLGITYPSGSIVGEDLYGAKGNWNKGPITLLKQLKTDTDGWNTVLNRSDSYPNINNQYGNNTTNYTINYREYKARIITTQEIANIVGFNSWDEKSKSNIWFYFDNHVQDVPSTRSYGWLYDRTHTLCTEEGCLNNADVVTYGYWTSSSGASNSVDAWSVHYRGRVSNYRVDSGFGLRPVITVPKSDVLG